MTIKEFEKKLYSSTIYRLACVQLKREGKLEKVKMGGSTVYLVSPEEAVLKGLEIIRKDKKGRKLLR